MPIDPSRLPAPPREGEPLPAAQESLEALALLARRRSTPIALMGEPGPDPAQTAALIRTAARTPDHGKLGPWRFVVLAGDGRDRAGAALAALAGEANPGAGPERLAFERDRFRRAPVVVMVVSTAAPHPKVPEWEQVLSAGAVCFQLVLAAHLMGFAAAWLSEWPTYDAAARAALNLAPHERIAGFIYIGSAKMAPAERVRPDVEARISVF